MHWSHLDAQAPPWPSTKNRPKGQLTELFLLRCASFSLPRFQGDLKILTQRFRVSSPNLHEWRFFLDSSWRVATRCQSARAHQARLSARLCELQRMETPRSVFLSCFGEETGRRTLATPCSCCPLGDVAQTEVYHATLQEKKKKVASLQYKKKKRVPFLNF